MQHRRGAKPASAGSRALLGAIAAALTITLVIGSALRCALCVCARHGQRGTARPTAAGDDEVAPGPVLASAARAASSESDPEQTRLRALFETLPALDESTSLAFLTIANSHYTQLLLNLVALVAQLGRWPIVAIAVDGEVARLCEELGIPHRKSKTGLAANDFRQDRCACVDSPHEPDMRALLLSSVSAQLHGSGRRRSGSPLHVADVRRTAVSGRGQPAAAAAVAAAEGNAQAM